MIIKIELKNEKQFLIEWWNWKEKSIQQKAQKIIKRKRIKLKKINIWKIEIKGWNWKQIKFLQKDQKQKLESKKIRTEVEIPTIKRIKM